jgi:predicted amidohydrolase
MRLAMAQISMESDMEKNIEKTKEYCKAAKDCDLLFFPEIQWTPFFPQYKEEELVEKIGKTKGKLCMNLGHPAIAELQKMAEDEKLMISPNLYIEQDGKYYDMSLMISLDGTLLGASKMVHILQAEQFYEQDYYEPSEEGFLAYETPFGKVGIVICFDRHLPESIRTCARKGAKLIIIPTANVKNEPLEMFEWEIRVQAFQNNVFIAMCNRVGVEGKMHFAGESLVVDPNGEVIYKAGDEEELVVCEIDLAKVDEVRCKRPYIRLIRQEIYEK